MKKLLLFLSLGAIIFSTGCNKQSTDTKTYQGTEYTIQYPSTRTYEEEEGPHLRLLGPWDKTNYRIRPNVLIFHEEPKLPSAMTTVQDFYKQTKRTNNSSHYKFISKEDISVNGLPAIKHIFEFYTQPNPDEKVMEIYLVKDQKVFTLSYSAELKNFDDYKKDAEEIMQSFLLD